MNEEERAQLTDWVERLQAFPARQESLQSALGRLARRPGEAEQARQLLARLPFGMGDKTVQDVCDKGELLLRNRGPLIPEKVIVDPTNTYILVYLLVISVLWFGCNNAAKEIVKEEAVYSRERAVNLGILPYLSSKFVVLSFLSALQVFMTMAIVYGGLEVLQSADAPAPMYRLNYPAQFGFLLLLAMTGVALGLLLSACVANADRAATLLPYVLIPQIILGGGILPMENSPLKLLAYVGSPSYWAFRAIHTGETELPEGFLWQRDYNDSTWLAAGALTAQMVGLLLLAAFLLRRWDVRKA